MKKFVLTILAIFYLGVSSGATVHVHYCMGKLIDWGISDSDTKDCSNCGMKKGNSKDCCKNEHHKLTLKDSPKASPVVYEFDTPGAGLAFINSNAYETTFIRHLNEERFAINFSFRTQPTPAFIRNCNFRI